MNESKFKFNKNIPAEILPSIQKNLLALEDLIPPWCHEVMVVYDVKPGEQGFSDTCPAASGISYEYRNAVVDIYPQYFNDDEAERMNSCIHEMCHVITLLVTNYAREQIKVLLPDDDDKHRKTILNGLKERNEAMVCDLTYILQTRLGVGQNVNELTEEWVKKLRA